MVEEITQGSNEVIEKEEESLSFGEGSPIRDISDFNSKERKDFNNIRSQGKDDMDHTFAGGHYL